MVQVIERAGAILRALEGHPEGRSVNEIAGAIDLPRSSVHRILKSLENEHLVSSVSDERGFRLGPALMRLASSASSWLAEHAHAMIVELAQDLGETVDLAVRSGDRAYFIDQVAGANRLQAISAVGLHFPLHCTANGKALLSQLADDEVVELVGSALEPLTASTVTDVDALIAELAETRATGLAFDREEHHDGICAVGTTIANPHGLPAALSVPVPATRFVERADDLAAGVLATRERIEAALAVS